MTSEAGSATKEAVPADILVMEDDAALARAASGQVLESGGYHVCVAESGTEARTMFEHLHPDLILLDLVLPDMNGLVLAATLKTLGTTPKFIRSARAEQVDRVLGSKLGADDFVAKPFDVDDLLAQVEAVLRRVTRAPQTEAAPPDRITMGELTIAPTRGLVTLRTEPVHLTPTEYRLLLALATHVNEVIAREALVQLIWGYADTSTGHLIDVHVGRATAEAPARGAPSSRDRNGAAQRVEARVRGPAARTDELGRGRGDWHRVSRRAGRAAVIVEPALVPGGGAGVSPRCPVARKPKRQRCAADLEPRV